MMFKLFLVKPKRLEQNKNPDLKSINKILINAKYIPIINLSILLIIY